MIGANDSISIWNKYKDPSNRLDIWVRHIIHKCSFEKTSIRELSGNTVNFADTFEVLIDYNKHFKTHSEWVKLDEAEKLYFFTLNTGDVVAKGEFYDEISGNSPNTISELRLKLFPNIFTIKFVFETNQSYKSAPHYEIMGV